MRPARRQQHGQAVRQIGYAGRYSAAEAGLTVSSGDVRPLLAVLSGEDSLTAGLEWQDDGLCAQVDPELFYQEKGGSNVPAKAVCARCPVRRPCLTDALRRPGNRNSGGYGVWGGTSPEEREQLLAQFPGDVEAAVDFALRDGPAADRPQDQEIAA